MASTIMTPKTKATTTATMGRRTTGMASISKDDLQLPLLSSSLSWLSPSCSSGGVKCEMQVHGGLRAIIFDLGKSAHSLSTTAFYRGTVHEYSPRRACLFRKQTRSVLFRKQTHVFVSSLKLIHKHACLFFGTNTRVRKRFNPKRSRLGF